jgi:hypothetical protein
MEKFSRLHSEIWVEGPFSCLFPRTSRVTTQKSLLAYPFLADSFMFAADIVPQSQNLILSFDTKKASRLDSDIWVDGPFSGLFPRTSWVITQLEIPTGITLPCAHFYACPDSEPSSVVCHEKGFQVRLRNLGWRAVFLYISANFANEYTAWNPHRHFRSLWTFYASADMLYCLTLKLVLKKKTLWYFKLRCTWNSHFQRSCNKTRGSVQKS